MSNNRLLTARDVADELGVEESRARRWINEMRCIRIGSDRAVTLDQLHDWLRTRAPA